MSMNNIVIEGNLTREPEMKLVGEKTVINFSIAYNTRTKDESGHWVDGTPSFFDIEYWPNDPQYWVKRLGKGTSVVVTGSLKQESWEKDGQKFSRVRIRAQEIFNKWLPELPAASAGAVAVPPPPSAAPADQGTGFPEDIPF